MELSLHTPSPWFTTWFRPRSTMRTLIKTSPERYALLIAILVGMEQAFWWFAQIMGTSEHFLAIVLYSMSFGALGGMLGLYLNGAILAWIGKRLGGRGDLHSVCAAISWSSLPLLLSLLLVPVQFLVSGVGPFSLLPFQLEIGALLVGVYAILMLWSFVLFLPALAEVHGFSLGHALATWVLSLLLSTLVFIIAIVICFVAIIIAAIVLA